MRSPSAIIPKLFAAQADEEVSEKRMSITPLTFTGVSSMSNDLQTVLSRAVQIATLPVTALQNKDSDILQEKTLLSAFNQPLTDLGNSIASLGKIAANNAISVTSSNPAAVSVVNSGATSSAVYTIGDITSIAQAASETSKNPYGDSSTIPVSSNGSMRLVAGGQNYDFTLQNNSLAGVRDQINSLGAGVTASILTTANGNYLSVAASGTGQNSLKLIDDPSGANTNVLTSNNQGSNAEFSLNGIPISQASNVVNSIIGGITFTILAKTTANQSVNLTLASDRTQLSSALQDFATNYNTVAQQINQQVGPAAGLLSGDFLVRQMQGDLRSLSGYQASGSIKSLSDLGITFGTNGQIKFDSAAFSSLSDAQVSGAFQFFGSATTGFGKLASNFTELTDPISGLIKVQTDQYTATDKRLQTSISDTTDRINAMQTALSARLQVADSLIAQLESQQKTVTATVQSLDLVLYGKQIN
jgi:flagellar hook-associated protein 2